MRFLRPRRVIVLLLLVALAVGGYLAVNRLRAAPAASLDAAKGAVRSAPADPGSLPAPGVYRYTQRGTERFAVGPIQVARTLPATALLVVRGAGSGTLAVGWRYAGDVEETLGLGSTGQGGQRIVERRLDVRLPLAGFTIGGRTDPASWRPGRPKVGTLEPVTYDLGGLVIRREAKVVRKESVDVGGQEVETWVIRADEDLTGKVNGDIHETVWWAPQLGLDVRRKIDFQLAGQVAHRLTSDLRLVSVIPERP